MFGTVERTKDQSWYPREECGIFGIYGYEDASRAAFYGLFALQHRGQESAGIVSSDGRQVYQYKGMGLASEVFKEEDLLKLQGKLAIGHVRYSTTGSSTLLNAQPFLVHFEDEYYALAHNGNIMNAHELRQELERSGSIFQSTMDSEIIIHLMAHHLKDGLEEALAASLSRLEGAYCLIMMTRNKIIAARDPRGFRPLSLGLLNGSWVVASETCAFDLVGAQYIRDVEPGEIIIINHNGIISLKPFAEMKPCHCIFELVYFARPDSQVFGQNVYLCRKRFGQELAREYKPDVDIVVPFPDSGVYAALGYSQESKVPFEMGIIRNHYVGRTFINPTQAGRDLSVRVKLNPVKELLENRSVLIIDDSIIRGTTSQNRVKNLRTIGMNEIHMAISCPPTLFPCPYGIDFSSKGELIAAKKGNEQEIADHIGLDSLHYLTIEGMIKATNLDRDCFCLACYDGNYPVAPPKVINKHCMEDLS
ncbi:MAG: amidophosphoribosyltransferase [Syntrophorhabdus sp.]